MSARSDVVVTQSEGTRPLFVPPRMSAEPFYRVVEMLATTRTNNELATGPERGRRTKPARVPARAEDHRDEAQDRIGLARQTLALPLEALTQRVR